MELDDMPCEYLSLYIQMTSFYLPLENTPRYTLSSKGGLVRLQTRIRCIIIWQIGFILIASLVAQEITGNISGTVTDPSGSVIPNATVRAVAHCNDVRGIGSNDAQLQIGCRR